MGHNWKTRLLACILGFCGALGGIGVMVTGLRFGGHIPMGAVALFCLAASALAASLAGRKSAVFLPLALVVLTFWAWKRLDLEKSLEALLCFVSMLYRSGYGWPLIRWSSEALSYADARIAFCFLGAWLSMGITLGFLNRGGVWLGAFAAALPLLPCLVLTDTVPEEKFLFLQLFSLLLLLFCSKNPKRGLYLFLPVALFLGVFFLLMPQETYKGQDAAERVWSWLEEKFTQEEPEGPQESPVVSPNLQGQQVNLLSAGPRPRWMIPTMHVTAPQSGTLYLRAKSFDRYTGESWLLDEQDGQLPFFESSGTQTFLQVETLTIHDSLYLPYGARSAFSGAQVLEDRVWGRVPNTHSATNYSVFYIPTDWSRVSQRENQDYTASGILSPHINGTVLFPNGEDDGFLITVDTPWERYLELPEETLERATAWLDSHMPVVSASPSQWETAQIICEMVRRSAAYDLSTQRMPANEDFALWFLENSETGYCVHFASAAAVLLRAAGIPSRYVSGYLVSTIAGEQTTVYQKNAHAWVEVYFPWAGWVMLEPTPGDGVADTLADTPSETTEPTEATTLPPETTEPTEATTLPKPTKPALTTPTEPSADDPQTPDKPAEKKPLPKWVKGLGWAASAAALLVAQWWLRLRLRKQRRRKGDRNRQVLTLWREAALCGKILGRPPREELHDLAQKAKFSQHAITPQERARAEELANIMLAQLERAPFWRKTIAFLLALG